MSRARRAWNDFFFTPRSTAPLALTRIALGLVVLVEAASWAPDLTTWFATGGLSPYQPDGGAGATVFDLGASPAAVRAAFALLVVAAACLTIGLATRAAAVTTFVLLVSFEHRMPYVMNSGDLMLRLLVGLLVLAPAGAALSCDRWLRHRDDFWTSPERPPWALRLVQLQVVAIYLVTVVEKLRSPSWRDGTALYYAFRSPEVVRARVPEWLVHQSTAIHVMTYGLLAVEVAIVVLVWPRRTRPFVLAAGTLMHLAGHVFLVLSVFTYVVLAAYVAFLPPDVAERLVSAVRRPSGRPSRSTSPGAVAAAAGAPPRPPASPSSRPGSRRRAPRRTR